MLLSRSANQQMKDATDGKDATADLQARVEKMVHRAFWDEALEALDSPDASVQIDRLHRLHLDLHEAIKPLLPSGHRALLALSAPFPPSMSPLHSAMDLLRDVLSALKERCAPVRDEELDRIQAQLDGVSAYHATDTQQHTLAAQTDIDALKATIAVSEHMKSDLNQTVLGIMSEEQIRAIVTEQARIRERELILSTMSKETVKEAWESWMGDALLTSHAADLPTWVTRLLDAIGANVPISANITKYLLSPSSGLDSESVSQSPPSPPNNLPPPFFFCAPALFHLQNHLQALVIVASLRSLVRVPQPSATASDFTHRLWTLLQAEIEPNHSDASAGDTKIINLADEVLRARKQAGDPAQDSEEHVRAAVERTLRAEDPVFVLLHKRVVEWLARALCAPPPRPPVAPETMRTGKRSFEGGQSVAHEVTASSGLPPPPKGFEDAVIAAGLLDAVRMLQTQCVQWVRSVWGDVVDA
ncbi:hypothetical protein BD626DRAFT_544495 [Schizophyllum amplum]|uniref:Uncharacterized protein n=1 Tax=Schizophyllum amplum TaxID=97359 RepID=A0A550CYT5_9AGAR|nr:hypothetical protein BD626DRAFT_544495 [Auriculariopsis ampla]